MRCLVDMARCTYELLLLCVCVCVHRRSRHESPFTGWSSSPLSAWRKGGSSSLPAVPHVSRGGDEASRFTCCDATVPEANGDVVDGDQAAFPEVPADAGEHQLKQKSGVGAPSVRLTCVHRRTLVSIGFMKVISTRVHTDLELEDRLQTFSTATSCSS